MTTIAVAGVVAGVLGIVFGLAASRRAGRAVRECRDLIQGAVGSNGTVDPRALRDIGFVRYDALREGAGQMSFSVALLNATGDGVVLSSINGRAETRTYAKPVLGGQGGTIALSPEEAQAVHSAQLGNGLSAYAPQPARRRLFARPAPQHPAPDAPQGGPQDVTVSGPPQGGDAPQGDEPPPPREGAEAPA